MPPAIVEACDEPAECSEAGSVSGVEPALPAAEPGVSDPSASTGATSPPGIAAENPSEDTAPENAAENPSEDTAPESAAENPSEDTAPESAAENPSEDTAPESAAENPSESTAPESAAENPSEDTADPPDPGARCTAAGGEPSAGCPIPLAVAVAPSVLAIWEPGATATTSVLVLSETGRDWPITVRIDPGEVDPSVSFVVSAPYCERDNGLCSYQITAQHDGSPISSPGFATASVIIELPDTGQTARYGFRVEQRAFSWPDALHVSLVYGAAEFLAAELGVPADELALVDAVQVEWADGSLGCAREGGTYEQAVIPGFLLSFVHTGAGDASSIHPVHAAGSLWRFVRPVDCIATSGVTYRPVPTQ